jgi:hypothetical protein
MRSDSIRPGTLIGGRKVARAINGSATFAVKKSRYCAPARLVTFADGTRAAFELGTVVDAVGWAEPLPAGNVASKSVKTPPVVRASDSRWRGESVHGMRTREHDLIAGTNMFDAGRVNGSVGAFRDGVGSVRDTGPSFPAPGQ